MAKLSKGQLKSIVKECLLEILSEGIGSSPPRQASIKRSPTRKRQFEDDARSLRPALDNIRYGTQPTNESRATIKEKNAGFDRAVTSAVGSLTDDPMMASIFSDTAATTLQEQLETDGAPGAGMAGQPMIEHVSDPTSVFGDAAANWATLAFAESKPK